MRPAEQPLRGTELTLEEKRFMHALEVLFAPRSQQSDQKARRESANSLAA